MRYRITVRGEGVELRGYVEFEDRYALSTLGDFANDMKPYGIVVASIVDNDYNPFTGTATQTTSGWHEPVERS